MKQMMAKVPSPHLAPDQGFTVRKLQESSRQRTFGLGEGWKITVVSWENPRFLWVFNGIYSDFMGFIVI